MMLSEIERRLAEQAQAIEKVEEIGRTAAAEASETRASTRGARKQKAGRVVAVEVDDALYAQLQHIADVQGLRGVRNALLQAARAGIRVLALKRR